MGYISIENINFSEKRVVVRLDLNLPIKDGKVLDVTRIKRVIPTLKKILSSNPKYIVILSHLGRPKPSSDFQQNQTESLAPVALCLQELLGQPIIFSNTPVGPDLYNELGKVASGSVILAENIRFYAGEEANSDEFSKQLSQLGDVFVNDTFSCSHRMHASVVGITKYLPSYAGLSLIEELQMLESILVKPNRPVIGIIAGSKVSTKIDLLHNLLNKFDYLFVGGGMANTMLYAQGYKMGGSLIENDRLGVAEAILEKAKSSKCELLLPIDAVVARKLEPNIATEIVDIDGINADQAMYDIGPKTQERLQNILKLCQTVLWNGPVGVYEVPPFDNGSTLLAKAISQFTQAGKITSVAGGGDTIAAITQCGAKLTYVSTAGGAFLEWLEGKVLPGIKALELQHSKNNTN